MKIFQRIPEAKKVILVVTFTGRGGPYPKYFPSSFLQNFDLSPTTTKPIGSLLFTVCNHYNAQKSKGVCVSLEVWVIFLLTALYSSFIVVVLYFYHLLSFTTDVSSLLGLPSKFFKRNHQLIGSLSHYL